MVHALGITTTAVRQQVNRLLWDGWLVREQRRRGPGRPADVFSLSEQAKRAFAHDVDEFARLLIEEIADAEGEEKLHAMLGRVSERLAQSLAVQAGSGPPAQRIERIVELLQQRGTVAEAQPTPFGMRLNLHTCPFHGLGDARHEICEVERQAIGRLGGGTAELRKSLARGHSCCEFEVGFEPQASLAT